MELIFVERLSVSTVNSSVVVISLCLLFLLVFLWKMRFVFSKKIGLFAFAANSSVAVIVLCLLFLPIFLWKMRVVFSKMVERPFASAFSSSVAVLILCLLLWKMRLVLSKNIEGPFTSAVNSSMARHNFRFSSITGIILCLLPRENLGGNKVPPLFKGQPVAFYACVVSVVFTFTGSFTALMIGDNSKTSRFCTLYSFVAMVIALSILAYVLLPDF